MPRVPILPENKTGGDADRLPTLKFTTKGERQRILCLETIIVDGKRVVAPVQVWVHTFKAPKLIDGQPMQKLRDSKDPSKGMEWDLDFIGQSLCLGDAERMQAKGSDPDNCISCRANRDYPEFINPPKMYFCMNVLRYATQPGSWNVQRPFQANVVPWKLTERQFNKLIELGAELGNGTVSVFTGQTVAKDLSLVDLRLGPCEDTGYQKYDIAPAEGIAVARSTKQVQDYVIANIWTKENRATEQQLEEAVARRQVNLTYLQSDIDRCLDQWRATKRAGAPATENFGPLNGASTADVQTGLDDLLAEASADPAPVSDDPFGVPQPDTHPAPSPDVPSAAAEPVLPPEPGELDALAGGAGLDQFAPEPVQDTAGGPDTPTAPGPDLLGMPDVPSAPVEGADSFDALIDSIDKA